MKTDLFKKGDLVKYLFLDGTWDLGIVLSGDSRSFMVYWQDDKEALEHWYPYNIVRAKKEP